MPRHKETRLLPYTPAQLFDLVADIERYPAFLPWCKAARVLERKDNTVTADLVIGYKAFSEQFRSLVTLDRPHALSVHYMSGPMSHLSNQWHFKPVADGCALSFEVDFDFQSPLLGNIMGAFFEKALGKMAGAFEARAHELYGSDHRVS